MAQPVTRPATPPEPHSAVPSAAQLPLALPAEVPSPTGPDEVFDRYARLVTTALGVPVGLVSLVSTDGQVFPGAVGLPEPWQQTRCTGLSHSFCQHVVAHDQALVVTDARQDPRLADNLAIDDIGVIAYAGFPLHDADGTAVGSLCAIDTQPRAWTQRELDVLADLAATAASELVLRRSRADESVSRAAAQAATARIAEVTESMAVGYLSMDPDWRITYVNAEGRRVLGATGREIVGEVLWDLYPATVGTEYERNYRAAAATGQTTTFDAYYPAPLDAWFELRATPEVGPTGVGMALYFLDITARRAAQEAAELAGRRLGAVGEVALALADAEDVTDLVTTMAEQGLAALGADGGAVAVPDPAGPGHLWSYITSSYGEDVQADYGHLPLDASLPVCEAYTGGRPVLLPDGDASSAYSTTMADVVTSTGCTAWACVPLRAGGEVIGVLTAGWRAPQPFDAEQLELLETFASQCAQALVRIGARDAELAAAAAARGSAAQQAALVAVARALGEADTEDDVLAVVTTHGLSLFEASVPALCLLDPDQRAVRTLTAENMLIDIRVHLQHLPADHPLPLVDCAVTGTHHFYGDLAATVADFPAAEAICTLLDVHAQGSVPLHANGRPLGSLFLGFAHDRTWHQQDRDLLGAFAALTAQALARIAAHDAERAASAEVAQFSETLQRSLLTSPPEPDHLHIAVRYSPAAATAQVGGDWYDAFITSDGATSLVIGDVTGHDRTAAAAMGQLRNLLRGIGYTVGQPPATVITTLDHAAHDLAVNTTATLVLARVEQTSEQRRVGARTMRWANAGHLPPLLIAPGGSTSYLEGVPDLMLGIDANAVRTDHQVVLEPGSTVLLYTDGLVERRRAPLQDGLDWLLEAVAALAELPVDELCDALLEQVGGALDDDVALLALRAHPEDEPRPAEAGPGYNPQQEASGRDSAAGAATGTAAVDEPNEQDG